MPRPQGSPRFVYRRSHASKPERITRSPSTFEKNQRLAAPCYPNLTWSRYSLTYFSARMKISSLFFLPAAEASASAVAFLAAHASSRLRRLRAVSGTAGCEIVWARGKMGAMEASAKSRWTAGSETRGVTRAHWERGS